MDMHPNHIAFCTSTCLASLDRFFSAVDALSPKTRDTVMFHAFIAIVGVKVPRQLIPDLSIAQQMQNAVNYRIFKEKCIQLCNGVLPDGFLIHGIVSNVLGMAHHRGNTDKIGEFADNMRFAVAEFEEQIKSTADERKRADLRGMIDDMERELAELPQTIQEARSQYEEFCDVVLPPLLKAHPFASDAAE